MQAPQGHAEVPQVDVKAPGNALCLRLGAGGLSARAGRLAEDVLAGTAGGMAMTLVGHPFDTVKVNLQTQPAGAKVYDGMVDCARKLLKQEGVAGLYSGVTSPIAGQMAFRATLFGSLGETKRWLSDRRGDSGLTYADFYVAGAISGAVASFVICPIDLFKCQLQSHQLRACLSPGYRPPYSSLMGCAESVLRQKGLAGCFQGLGPTLLRETVAYSAFLGSFDVMKCEAARSLGVEVKDLPFWATCLAGGIGGLIYWTSIYPIDVVKSAMQSDNVKVEERKYRNSWHAVRALYEEGGLRRFGKGFVPCIVRAAPANVALFVAMDEARRWIPKMT